MKEFDLTYLHSTGERTIVATSPVELFQKLEELINDPHVIDSSISVATRVLAF